MFVKRLSQQTLSTFEEFVSRDGEVTEEIATKIEWAKAKADWLDPFISKEDQYLDSYDKDEIIQPECPRKILGIIQIIRVLRSLHFGQIHTANGDNERKIYIWDYYYKSGLLFALTLVLIT